MKKINVEQPDKVIGLAFGEEADFEALNCLIALKLIRNTKLLLNTEPAFLPNACYAFARLILLI